MVTQTLEVRVNRMGAYNQIEAIQEDSGRILKCVIADAAIPEGSTARIYAVKPSGAEIYNDATVDGNAVLIELTTQMLAEIGYTVAQVELTNEGKYVTSFEFRIIVRRKLKSESSVESTNEFQALERAMADVTGTTYKVVSEYVEKNGITTGATPKEAARIENSVSKRFGSQSIVTETETTLIIGTDLFVGDELVITDLKTEESTSYAIQYVNGDLLEEDTSGKTIYLTITEEIESVICSAGLSITVCEEEALEETEAITDDDYMIVGRKSQGRRIRCANVKEYVSKEKLDQLFVKLNTVVTTDDKTYIVGTDVNVGDVIAYKFQSTADGVITYAGYGNSKTQGYSVGTGEWPWEYIEVDGTWQTYTFSKGFEVGTETEYLPTVEELGERDYLILGNHEKTKKVLYPKLKEDIAGGKLSKSGWNANKYLGTDENGKVIEKEVANVSSEDVEAAVNKYLEENPIETIDDDQLKEAVENALQTAKDNGEFEGADGYSIYSVSAEYPSENTSIARTEINSSVRTLQIMDLLVTTNGNVYSISAMTNETVTAQYICNIKGADGENGSNGKNGYAIYSVRNSYAASDVSIPYSYINLGSRALQVNDLLVTSNGYLYIVLATAGSVASCSYVCSIKGATGVAGSAGANGTTPHIGENGNWWIGEVDTGVSAEHVLVERVEMTSDDTAVELEANKLYVFPEMETLELTLADPDDTSIVSEYHVMFQSGATATTLTLPDTINTGSLTIEASKVYELSIMEGMLTYQSWAVS